MGDSRQRRRAKARGVKLERDPTALDLLSAHMFRMEITHVEFTHAEVESALQSPSKSFRVVVDGNDKEAPALLALHMQRLGVTRVAFSNSELSNLTPGQKTIVDGDENVLRITLVPSEIADMAAELPNFKVKGRGQDE